MRRRSLCLSIALPVALLTLATLSACGRKKSEVKPVAENEGREGKPSCALPASGVLDKDAVVSTGCIAVVSRTLVVKNGAKLVVEPGGTLAFDPGAGLVIEKGILLARGTEQSKVVFTSHGEKKSPGNWLGITFADDGAAGGSTLLQATVEYAGGAPIVAATDAGADAPSLPMHYGIKGSIGAPASPFEMPTRAAVILAKGARNVSLEHLRVAHADGPAVVVHEAASIASFRALDTEDVTTSVVLPAQTLAVIGESTLAPGVTVFGNVTKSIAWPKLAVPISVVQQLVVDSGDKKSPAIFDVGEGNELRLGTGVGIDVGNATSKKGAGAIVARKVRFLASAAAPGGEWASLSLYDAPAGTVIDGCTFEHGGNWVGAGGYGSIGLLGRMESYVILLPSNEKGVVILHNTFKDNVAAAMSGGGENCHGHESKAQGNVSIGQDLCWIDPFLTAFGSSAFGGSGLGDMGLGAETGNMIGVGDSVGYGGLGMKGSGAGGGGSGGVGLGSVGSFGTGSGGSSGMGYGGGGGKAGAGGSGGGTGAGPKVSPTPTTQASSKSP